MNGNPMAQVRGLELRLSWIYIYLTCVFIKSDIQLNKQGQLG